MSLKASNSLSDNPTTTSSITQTNMNVSEWYNWMVSKASQEDIYNSISMLYNKTVNYSLEAIQQHGPVMLILGFTLVPYLYTVHQKLQEMELINTALRTQNKNLFNSYNALANNHNDLKTAQNDLQDDVSLLNEHHDSLNLDILAIQEGTIPFVDSIAKSHNKLRNNYLDMAQSFKKLSKEHNALTKNHNSLNNDLKSLIIKNNVLHKNLDSLTNEYNSFKQNYNSFVDNYNSFVDNYNLLNQKYNILTEKLDIIDQKIKKSDEKSLSGSAQSMYS